MPFKSEKQRRYLWANEPEIARDWTDTYGSGIHRALGGRIGFYKGSDRHSGTGGWSPGAGSPGTTSSGGNKNTSSNTGGNQGSDHGHSRFDVGSGYYGEPITSSTSGDSGDDDKALSYVNWNKPPVRPNVGSGIGGGIKNFLGNWGSTVGGSQLGGGLGSMLFGPWGMLLGSIFGGAAGRRAYQASQTDEKETIRDILFGNPDTKSTLLSNLFNPQPKGEGIETVYPRRSSEEIQKIADLNNMGYDEVIDVMFNRNQIKPVNSTGQRNDLVQEVKLNRQEKTELEVLKGQKEMEDTFGPLTPEQEQRMNDLLQKELEV
jgi:hypothetical protein|tara:strand:- start:1010 stop:1963 length:954 start_codon:yes stop_codon:yes gene_type:complete